MNVPPIECVVEHRKEILQASGVNRGEVGVADVFRCAQDDRVDICRASNDSHKIKICRFNNLKEVYRNVVRHRKQVTSDFRSISTKDFTGRVWNPLESKPTRLLDVVRSSMNRTEQAMTLDEHETIVQQIVDDSNHEPKESGKSRVLMGWRAKLEKEPPHLRLHLIDQIVREVRRRLGTAS